MRIVFGFVWLVDGYLKFQPGMSQAFPQMIVAAGQGQPAWLHPWFSFWASVVGANPAPWTYLIGAGEVLLGLAVMLGVMRKTAYLVGILLSLLIWSVPEGFGGPYGPGSTDIGTGVIYAFVFIFLLIVNAAFGPSHYSLDWFIEKKLPAWRIVAEA